MYKILNKTLTIFDSHYTLGSFILFQLYNKLMSAIEQSGKQRRQAYKKRNRHERCKPESSSKVERHELSNNKYNKNITN